MPDDSRQSPPRKGPARSEPEPFGGPTVRPAPAPGPADGRFDVHAGQLKPEDPPAGSSPRRPTEAEGAEGEEGA